MKKSSSILSLMFLASLFFSNTANAIVLWDCDLNVFQFQTWQWNNDCWLEMELEPDIPGIIALKVTNVTSGRRYIKHPNWTGPYLESGYGTHEVLITRTGTPPNYLMFAELHAKTWALKYETQTSFTKPLLWAPIGAFGSYYYYENGWHYVPELNKSDEDNLCPASCGSASIAYPGTP